MSKVISLRKFRDSVADITEQIEVSRRDQHGNHQILGTWTPASGGLPPVEYQGLDLGIETGDRTILVDAEPVPDGVIAIRGGQYVRVDSPEEARVIATALPAIRPVPKPSQKKVRRS